MIARGLVEGGALPADLSGEAACRRLGEEVGEREGAVQALT